MLTLRHGFTHELLLEMADYYSPLHIAVLSIPYSSHVFVSEISLYSFYRVLFRLISGISSVWYSECWFLRCAETADAIIFVVVVDVAFIFVVLFD